MHEPVQQEGPGLGPRNSSWPSVTTSIEVKPLSVAQSVRSSNTEFGWELASEQAVSSASHKEESKAEPSFNMVNISVEMWSVYTKLVQDLLAIIVEERYKQKCWEWVQGCVSELWQEASLEVEEIAQVLLFAQEAQWELKIWRDHLPNFRKWHSYYEQAITRLKKPKAICDLITGISRSEGAFISYI
jgi:hypothetical protein